VWLCIDWMTVQCVRRLTSKVLASVLFISLAQYANISTSSPLEISHLVENRCGNGTSGMERLFAKRKKTMIDIAIKRWAFSIKWKEGVISTKWKRLFHSNEKNYFIQMGGVISFKWEGLFHSNIQMRRVISFKWEGFIPFKWGGLFNSNGKGGYFIQIVSANDYIQIILLPKLLPFVKECMIDRLNIIVQEDKALSHAFKHQKLVFMNVDVLRLSWSSNSSDLNMIEPCWPWMKRHAPRSRAAVDKAWPECWHKELPQWFFWDANFWWGNLNV
jgi:hypothetical protein